MIFSNLLAQKNLLGVLLFFRNPVLKNIPQITQYVVKFSVLCLLNSFNIVFFNIILLKKKQWSINLQIYCMFIWNNMLKLENFLPFVFCFCILFSIIQTLDNDKCFCQVSYLVLSDMIIIFFIVKITYSLCLMY